MRAPKNRSVKRGAGYHGRVRTQSIRTYTGYRGSLYNEAVLILILFLLLILVLLYFS